MSVAALSLFLSKMIPFGTWVHARASTNHHTRFNLRSRGRGARWPVLSLWDRAKQLCNLKRRPWFHTASSPRAESGPIPLHFMDFVSIQSSLGIPGRTLSSLYGGEVARFVAGGPHHSGVQYGCHVPRGNRGSLYTISFAASSEGTLLYVRNRRAKEKGFF